MKKRTVTELRLARGWTQEELARRTGTTRDYISKVERKALGPSPRVLERLCLELGCYPEELDVAPTRAPGRPAKPEAARLALFQETPPKLPRPEWTSAMRLGNLRREYPGWMAGLAWDPSWDPFLEEVASESRPETIFQLSELHRGAHPTEVTTDWMGFRKWPVVDKDGRGGGSYRRSALVTDDWLMTFQVYVLTPRRYRLDGLILVREPQRTHLYFEIDGNGHDPAFDLERDTALGMRAVRIPAAELLTGPSLTERLRAMGFCRPR